jgi:hypothetical protein
MLPGMERGTKNRNGGKKSDCNHRVILAVWNCGTYNRLLTDVNRHVHFNVQTRENEENVNVRVVALYC